jgi:hypothetical protein
VQAAFEIPEIESSFLSFLLKQITNLALPTVCACRRPTGLWAAFEIPEIESSFLSFY